MLNAEIRDYRNAVRTLYAAAVGENEALDESLINSDHISGRLSLIRDKKTDEARCLSYIHRGMPLRISRIDIRTLSLRTETIEPKKKE